MSGLFSRLRAAGLALGPWDLGLFTEDSGVVYAHRTMRTHEHDEFVSADGREARLCVPCSAATAWGPPLWAADRILDLTDAAHALADTIEVGAPPDEWIGSAALTTSFGVVRPDHVQTWANEVWRRFDFADHDIDDLKALRRHLEDKVLEYADTMHALPLPDALEDSLRDLIDGEATHWMRHQKARVPLLLQRWSEHVDGAVSDGQWVLAPVPGRIRTDLPAHDGGHFLTLPAGASIVELADALRLWNDHPDADPAELPDVIDAVIAAARGGAALPDQEAPAPSAA